MYVCMCISTGLFIRLCDHHIKLYISCRYSNVLLKRVSQGGICYSKNRMAFVSRRIMPFKAEEYSDVQGQ